MRGKKANGEGSIYLRSDGRWASAISVGTVKRKTFYGKTRQEVAAKLTGALKTLQDGLPLLEERQTLGEFLKSWLECVRPSVRRNTFVRYEEYIRLHVLPELGRVKLARLLPQHLQRLYADRLEAGLSPTSVNHLHAVIHRALRQAVLWGLVARNVADLATPPRSRHHEMSTLAPEQAQALLQAASGDRLEALYVLALTTGMRQGEILALRWRDVNLEGGTVQVRGTLQHSPDGLVIAEPKTASSRRQVALTSLATAALRLHRVTQAAERLLIGPAWEDNDMVFANEVGRPIEVRNLIRRSFLPLLERAGVPRIRFHDLRHSAATLLLGEGVHPKVVAEMLGHSQISTTLDLYSHVTPTMQREAAETLDSLLRA